MATLQFPIVRKTVPNVKVPGTNTALLTEARKMPCLSWSLPAHDACPAALFGENAICGSNKKAHDGCYAFKGRYMMNVVRRAQMARFGWAVQCMRTPEGQDEFVRTMVDAIAQDRSGYFRVHDSGDLFSPTYTRCWARICRALPDIRFWFPTRTWRFLDRPSWAGALLELAALPNVTLRPSALYFDDVAPKIPGMAAGSTATTKGFTCPAPMQGNACQSCRACWISTETPISYHKH